MCSENRPEPGRCAALETIAVRKARESLRGTAEITLIDVREFGQFGEGHPFFAVQIRYSGLEQLAPWLMPRRSAPIMRCDADDGIAERAAARLDERLYENVFLLEGGVPASESDGVMLYGGVNLPSKTLDEFVDEACGTPRISTDASVRMRNAGRPILPFDGRTGAWDL